MRTRKYEFYWDLLGDTQDGRPNLGDKIDIKVYRLMQFTFRDVLEREFGTEEADRLFYEAGKLAGVHYFHQLIDGAGGFMETVSALQDSFKRLGAGVIRIEKAEPPFDEILLTVAEDADCSGLPELDYEICSYDEGFIAGVLEATTKRAYHVKEIDCWCTGDRVCRFRARAQ